MRYTHMFHSPPSPSDAGLIVGKAASLSIQKSRLPKSRHHHIRKASQSTGASSILSLENPLAIKQEEQPTHEVKAVARPVAPIKETIVEVEAEAEAVTAAAPAKTPIKKSGLPQIKQWDSYLHWLCLTEEPGTLWTAALCAAFRDCLITDTTYPAAATPAESAARIDDIYWSFYLPLDPLLSHMEDRILSGYLLHVWTMFIELGKRIPHDDEGQDRLVELLKELVRLPPMEVRTWEGNDAPWSDLPTLDDALLSAWDELYDLENQTSHTENAWLNYFAFLGRLVAAEVTPEWWEIPGTTLKEVMTEQNQPSNLTRYKAMAVAEFMNQAGDAFFEWCMDAGVLDVKKDLDVIVPLTESPTRLDWFENRKVDFTRDEVEELGL